MDYDNFKNLRIGIIGGSYGLGSFFVKFFKSENFDVCFSSRKSGDDFAKSLGVKRYSSNIELVENCDVVILCVPISSMKVVLDEVYSSLKGKIFLEFCSVKEFVVDEFKRLEKKDNLGIEFHSIHPMFPDTIDCVKGHGFLFNYTNKENSKFLKDFRNFLKEKEAILEDLDYVEHDKMMALVQGLNHFTFFTFSKTMTKLNFDLDLLKNLASPPFRCFSIFCTRYVLQNAKLYAEIQFFNSEIKEVLNIFREEIDKFYDIIERKDEDEFVEYVDSMKDYFSQRKIDSDFSNKVIEFVSKNS